MAFRRSYFYFAAATVACGLSVASCAEAPGTSTDPAGANAPDTSLVGPLSSADWKGKVPKARQKQIERASKDFTQGLKKQDDDLIKKGIAKIAEALGPYISVPEVRPEYGTPIDRETPDFERVKAAWQAGVDAFANRLPWRADVIEKQRAAGTLSRLRVSSRIVRAYLQSAEAGLSDSEGFTETARAGLEYLLSRQGSNGAFGYPYSPGARSAVARQAAAIVERARKEGFEIVENDFIIIDPTQSGGLQFGNGMVGVTLLYAHELTGEVKYLDAAKRAGDWAFTANTLSPNFNYNCFAGYLLARLYRVTGELGYLEKAAVFMDLGVMPGQLADTGRWLDPHNARIQYHSVMLRAMAEYYLALKQAGDEKADFIEARLKLGLDNLALQINSFGASNVHELLSLDALALGLLIFGPNADWDQAASINVNYLLDHFTDKLAENGLHLTETLASYLLYRAADTVEDNGFEYQVRATAP